MLANAVHPGCLTRHAGAYIVFVMIRRRRLRWLALRLRRAARSHYMLAVTAVAVAFAAAAGLGAFDDEQQGAVTPIARATLPPLPTADATLFPQFLTVTYVLVSSEEERVVWDNVEETINQRELLSKLAFEVLVVTNAEQEAAAYELIDAVREQYPWNEYVIQDLRE